MFNPETKESLPIPVHGKKDLKTGLFRALLKKAGIDTSEV
jgi:predicted RNA binding protein YcfA (HicA-like mRNA interferase family)